MAASEGRRWRRRGRGAHLKGQGLGRRQREKPWIKRGEEEYEKVLEEEEL